MGPKPKGRKAKGETEEEKVAREEEERKQRDAEAKRIADEAEKLRLENLRIQTERRAFRAAELANLEEENIRLLDKLSEIDSKMKAEISHEASQKDWMKYRDPVEEPDALSECDMNTFLSLNSDMNILTMSDTMDFVKRVEVVAEAVQIVWSDSLADGQTVVQSRSRDYIEKFSTIIYDKIDSATAHCLRFVDAHINDKAEINIEESADKVSMGMWASFNENRPIRKSVQFEKMGVQLDVPKQILNQESRFVHRVVRMPIDTLSHSAYESSTSIPESIRNNPKLILGDIIQIDILLPPPQAFTMRAKKWTIRDNSAAACAVAKSPYPSSVACRCYFKVPAEVVMSDDVRVALWDDENKAWTEEGLSDYQYAESTRMAQFYIAAVGLIALVRDRVWEMPYKSWSLNVVRNVKDEVDDGHPRYNGNGNSSTERRIIFERQVRFTLVTANHEIVIDIIGTSCKLIGPDRIEFEDLLGVEMSPGALLTKLQRRGVNLLPTANDLKNVTDVAPKDVTLSDEVLRQISRCANAFDFKSSPWSQSIPKSQVGLLVRESSVYTGLEDSFDFECVLAQLDKKSESYEQAPDVADIPPSSSGVKFTLVMGNEYGNRKLFSHVPRPEEVSHLELSAAMTSRITSEAGERVERCNVRFQKTVYTLLHLINPLSLT